MAFWEMNPEGWLAERTICLCFTCSVERIHSDQWRLCQCPQRTRPKQFGQTNPVGTSWFCHDCRLRFYKYLLSGIYDKALEYRLRERLFARPPLGDPAWLTMPPEGKLKMFIEDTDFHNRNHCVCGLDWTSIKNSYPRKPPPRDYTIDRRFLFRECLMCGFHVENQRITVQPSSLM
jgi:hypothetical protein